MGRKGKKTNKGGGGGGGGGVAQQRRHEPRMVDHVSDSSDEEISEDGAFDSEDERRYGSLFAPSKSKSKSKSEKSRKGGGDDDDDDNSDDSSVDDDASSSSSSSSSSDGSSYSGDGIAPPDASSDEDMQDGDGGQYMLDLLNNLDGTASSQANQQKQAASAALAHTSLIAESEFSSAAVKGAELTLDSLMGGIADTKGFGTVQRTFRDIGRGGSAEDGGDGGNDRKKKGSKVLETTKAPVSKVISERASRKVNYADRSDDVKAWEEAVKQNREAETLDFRPKDRVRITRDELVGKFEPRTEFEREVAVALEEAGERDEKEVEKREREELLGAGGGDGEDADLDEDDDDDDLGSNRIGLAEFKRRRGELAKMRALMFYEERKRHRMNKIKSKKYRKIRKKKRDRLSEAEKAAAAEEDPELARELEEKEEMERMRERMSLAHRNTSKWAKRVLRRGGKVDTDTRRALSAQLQAGEDLRKKMEGTAAGGDDDGSEEEGDGTLLDQARAILRETEEDGEGKKNGGGGGADEKSKGLFSLAFMKRGMELQRERAKEEARQLLHELEANASDDDRDGRDDDARAIDGGKDDEGKSASKNKKAKKKEKALSAAETEKLLQKGKLVASALEFGNSNSIAVGGGIDVDLSSSGAGREERPWAAAAAAAAAQATTAADEELAGGGGASGHTATMPGRRVDAATATEEGSLVKDDAPMTVGAAAAAAGAGDQKGSSSSSKRKIALVQEARKHDGANPWVRAATTADKSDGRVKGSTVEVGKKKRRKVATGGGGGVNKDGVVDVQGAFAIMGEEEEDSTPDENEKNNKMVLVEEGKQHGKAEEGGTKKNIASLSQDELVRRAFAAPTDAEAEEEFEKEKEAMREREDPTRKKKDDDKFASGWGSWAGKGAPAPRPPRKLPKKLRPPEKKAEMRKRKDDQKKRVIINEKRVKKNAKFQLAEIPYPYSSREQYERAMAGGIGQEWNVSGAVKEMTRPEIISRCGKIIAPIAKKAKAKRAPAKFW